LFALTAIWAPVGAVEGYFWFCHTTHLLLPAESTNSAIKGFIAFVDLRVICNHKCTSTTKDIFNIILITSFSLCPLRLERFKFTPWREFLRYPGQMFDLIEKNILIARVGQVPDLGFLLTFRLALFTPIFPLEKRCRLSPTMS
jgi:hypothetical protein